MNFAIALTDLGDAIDVLNYTGAGGRRVCRSDTRSTVKYYSYNGLNREAIARFQGIIDR